MENRIVFNVSGKKYETDNNSFSIYSGKLQQLVSSRKQNGEIFINRPSNSFEAILAYHQTDELHIPQNTCPAAFKSELDYYEIDHKKLAPCCFYKYTTFLNDRVTLEKFHRKAYPKPRDYDIHPEHLSRWLSFRRRMWRILSDHNSSAIAKVYFYASVVLVLLSILSLALGTHKSFRRPLERNEKQVILDHEDNHNNRGCGDVLERWFDRQDFEQGETLNTTCSDLYHAINKKTTPIDILWYIDVSLVGVFVVDFFVRIAFCWNLKQYFKSAVNTLDTIALIGSLGGLVINNVWAIESFKTDEYDIITNLQVLRAVRLLRIVQNLESSKVLSFVFITSIKDLGVLLSFFFIGVLIFSNFIYYLEDRESMPDIPAACWWSIITMTTVGFGDIVPNYILGRLVGTICAISGVVLFAITIPIFVNTFVLVYNYSKLQNKTDLKYSKVNCVDIHKDKF